MSHAAHSNPSVTSPRVFRWFVWLSVIGSVSAVGWLGYTTRHTIMAHWYWRKWTQAVTPEDEVAWRECFFSEPHADEKIAVAVASASRSTPRQSYWVVTGRGVSDIDVYRLWSRLFVAEAAHNPELIQLRVHALRWTPPSDRPKQGPATSLDYFTATDEALADATDAELVWPELQVVLPFVELCWLSGRFDLARDTNESNWRQRFAEWHTWFKENGPYLRWDDKRDALMIDEDARSSAIALPHTARRIPSVATPQPDWIGVTPN